MSGKVARKLRKEYHRAGAMYWTQDMQAAIEKIHRARRGWKLAALSELFVIAGGVLLYV